jgi:serine protease Do
LATCAAFVIAYCALPSVKKSARLAGPTVMIALADGHGSGVYLGNGRVLTVAHVVDGEDSLTVKTDRGEELPVEVLWSSKKFDVAVLQINVNAKIKPAQLACRMPKIGEPVSFSGNPLRQTFITTYGRVAGTPRSLEKIAAVIVPVSATILPGMSGGPVFDERGYVIGLNDAAMLAPAQGMMPVSAPVAVGFFVPAKVACILMSL